MYRDYRDKVQFFYVYKSVQHPEINNYVTAFTLKERLKHVAEAKRLFKTEIPWICDNMKNDLKHAFGSAPNGEFVLDPNGRIIRKRFWSNPETLRAYLAETVGPSKKVTTVADLPAAFTVERRQIASGVVPRISLPGRLSPMKIEPTGLGDETFFAKLRAEATADVFDPKKRKGKLYLGVYLDPLYRVHWNNRAGRVSISFKTPDGVTLTPTTLKSPNVKEDADVDPRQFLIDVSRGESDEPIEATVTYTVCDDAETFCLTNKQKYLIHFARNGNLGSRPGIFMPKMFAEVRKLDTNKDGNVTPDELPKGQVTLYVGHMDYNGNGIIERAEIDKFMSMFNNGRGFDSSRNDGQTPK